MDIGKNIKEKRQAAGMKQAELAEKVNATQRQVSSWESGKFMPSIENIVKIADVFGCKVDELVR